MRHREALKLPGQGKHLSSVQWLCLRGRKTILSLFFSFTTGPFSCPASSFHCVSLTVFCLYLFVCFRKSFMLWQITPITACPETTPWPHLLASAEYSSLLKCWVTYSHLLPTPTHVYTCSSVRSCVSSCCSLSASASLSGNNPVDFSKPSWESKYSELSFANLTVSAVIFLVNCEF